jgi:hypothetical protein
MEESEPNSDQQLTVVPAAGKPVRTSSAIAAEIVVPAVIADAGDQAVRHFLEFFAATIRNKNTRTAYLHAVSRFFARCEHHHIGQLAVSSRCTSLPVSRHLAQLRPHWR